MAEFTLYELRTNLTFTFNIIIPQFQDFPPDNLSTFSDVKEDTFRCMTEARKFFATCLRLSYKMPVLLSHHVDDSPFYNVLGIFRVHS